jgi:uncharacterized protein (DUF1330 family)
LRGCPSKTCWLYAIVSRAVYDKPATIRWCDNLNDVRTGAPPKRVAIVEWESLEKAKAFYESEEYKRVIPMRDKSSNFRAFVIEGIAK